MTDDEDLIFGDVRKQFLSDETKLIRHRESLKQSVPIIFCVRCGSTTVDQNFPKELRCYECGTTLSWDNKKFSIRRGLEQWREVDVIAAFEDYKK